MTKLEPWDPKSRLAHGDELDPECFPELGTLSAAHFYSFVPIPNRPEHQAPELVYVRQPEDEWLPFFGALSTWNTLWECGSLRPEILTDRRKDFPASLQWLFDNSAASSNIRLLPYTTTAFSAYDSLYQLLPLTTLKKHGLPPLKRGLWPTTPPWRERVSSILPSNFKQRLGEAFASLVWPLLNPRTPLSGFARNHSPVLLLHNLDYWLPYLDLVIQERARALGRCDYDEEDREKQMRQHQTLRRRSRGAPFSPERPLFGGSLWYGEAEAHEVLRKLVALADHQGRLREILDAFHSHRLEDDFSNLWSWEKEDFERKLYRKRDKVKISFVQMDDTLPVIGPDSEIRENLLWSDLFALLDRQQRSIVVCLRNGHTQTEIASRLGYANHSVVSKALKRIRAQVRLLLEN